MRYLYLPALLILLVGCQTSTDEQPTTSETGKPSTELLSDKYYYEPMKMAKRVTDDADTKHSLKVGDFKHYDAKTLSLLAQAQEHFDTPGKSIIYQSTYIEMGEIYEKQKVTDRYEEIKSEMEGSKKHLNFLDKVSTRLINLTPAETSNISICIANQAWQDFPSNQKEIFDKMAQGISLTPEENQGLIYSPRQKSMGKNTSVQRKCTLVTLALYSKYKRLFIP